MQVATVLNSTDWDPSVALPKMGVCFHKPLPSEPGVHTYSHVLINILGSMTQYQGTAQGLLYDPATMAPLVNTTAMARALELYGQLASLMPDEVVDIDDASLMTSGRCALGFSWSGACNWHLESCTELLAHRVNLVQCLQSASCRTTVTRWHIAPPPPACCSTLPPSRDIEGHATVSHHSPWQIGCWAPARQLSSNGSCNPAHGGL